MGGTLFPLVYILYKRVSNKLFFLSACIGFYTLIELLLIVMALPIGIFLVKIAPQLAEQDQITYLLPLLTISEFIQEWWFYLFHLVLTVLLPLIIYRRYELFHSAVHPLLPEFSADPIRNEQ